ncbi:hypothetical protein BH23PLA1_BH23PLA1_42560 [soil metagenome]
MPPGKYTLQARHPSGGMRREREVVVRPGEPAEARIEFLEADLRVGRSTGSRRSTHEPHQAPEPVDLERLGLDNFKVRPLQQRPALAQGIGPMEGRIGDP